MSERALGRPGRVVVVGVVLLLLASAASAVDDGDRTHDQPVVSLSPPGVGNGSPGPPATDNTVTRIHLRANGSARWIVQVRTRLDSEQRVEEYRAFQKRLRGNRSKFLDPFARGISASVSGAANVTGRAMRATDFRITTEIQQVPRKWGTVTYSFTWREFARADGEALVAGDVFEGGFFLAPNDTMEYRAPEGYRLANPSPAPDERTDRVVVWNGRRDFANHRPKVRMVPVAGTTTAARTETATATPTATRTGTATATPTATRTGTATATPTAGTDGTGNRSTDGDARGTADATRNGSNEGSSGRSNGGKAGGPGVALVAGGLGAAAVLLVGGYVVRERGVAVARKDGNGDGDDEDDEGGDDTSGSVILTDADKVVNLLEDEGGQLRQSEIADRMDWSSSKTSRTLSDMAEDGDIEKLRIGRENVIRLPEDDDGE